jgi:sugar phosphate isomerase/epimerase
MPSFSIGCQTYSWEMLESGWQGAPEDILEAVSAAGYAGVEFSNNMIGAYLEQPGQFEKALEANRLRCSAFAYARNGFSDPGEFEADLAGAEKALRFAAHFGIVLCLGGPSSPSRQDYGAKFDQAVRFYREVAQRAQTLGVVLAIHPHSHHTSLVVTAAEYDTLLQAVAAEGIQFNPDSGHILRGGQDLLGCLQRYRERIVHVHIKDVDARNEWAPLGKGITPLAQIFGWMEAIGYAGWVVIEEESDAARTDIPKAVAANRLVLRAMGY